ncbi:hypothetical protein CFP71_11855 [Amycolatopsis thailandensis]|uniref:Uncharacterized protein n=1 Tax=Amycolatopsis thailandensis TaxID=589330 RepID=A0A229SCQ6_9PSEU|nr:hypothetical protein CFP71_11855 [Amycolatopsis thailandensis]
MACRTAADTLRSCRSLLPLITAKTLVRRAVEAGIGGLLLCSFGLTVLFYGVFLLREKKPSEGSPFGKADAG